MKRPESRKPSCTSMPHQYGNHEVTKDHNHCLHSHGSRHNTKHRADVCGRLDVPITSPSATYYITVFLYTYTVPILHTMKIPFLSSTHSSKLLPPTVLSFCSSICILQNASLYNLVGAIHPPHYLIGTSLIAASKRKSCLVQTPPLTA